MEWLRARIFGGVAATTTDASDDDEPIEKLPRLCAADLAVCGTLSTLLHNEDATANILEFCGVVAPSRGRSLWNTLQVYQLWYVNKAFLHMTLDAVDRFDRDGLARLDELEAALDSSDDEVDDDAPATAAPSPARQLAAVLPLWVCMACGRCDASAFVVCPARSCPSAGMGEDASAVHSDSDASAVHSDSDEEFERPPALSVARRAFEKAAGDADTAEYYEQRARERVAEDDGSDAQRKAELTAKVRDAVTAAADAAVKLAVAAATHREQIAIAAAASTACEPMIVLHGFTNSMVVARFGQRQVEQYVLKHIRGALARQGGPGATSLNVYRRNPARYWNDRASGRRLKPTLRSFVDDEHQDIHWNDHHEDYIHLDEEKGGIFEMILDDDEFKREFEWRYYDIPRRRRWISEWEDQTDSESDFIDDEVGYLEANYTLNRGDDGDY